MWTQDPLSRVALNPMSLFPSCRAHAPRCALAALCFCLISCHMLWAQNPSQNPASAPAAANLPNGLGAPAGPTYTNCLDPAMADSPSCMSSSSGMPLSQGLSGMSMGSGGYFNGRPTPTITYTDNAGMRTLPSQRPVTRLPERLTEFQKLVAATTGQVLPIYGADLFQNVPSTFAPLDRAPIPSDYVVGPGDMLLVRVWGQVDFTANLRVSHDGNIFLPQIGAVHVAGLSFSELDPHIRAAIGRVYRNFDITVDLGQIRAIQVYLAGAARRPGVYTVSSLSTAVDALFAGGGPAPQGSMRKIELRRNGVTIAHIDLYKVLIEGKRSNDITLLSGDVIYIPPVGPQVAVWGSIHFPAIYELVPGDTVAALLKAAGGVTVDAAGKRISLERIVNHSSRQTFEITLDTTGQSTRLKSGDMLRILSIIPRYQKTVTLRGNVANPGHHSGDELLLSIIPLPATVPAGAVAIQLRS